VGNRKKVRSSGTPDVQQVVLGKKIERGVGNKETEGQRTFRGKRGMYVKIKRE